MKAAAGSQQAATPLLTAGCRHPLIGQRLTLLSANPTNDDLVLTVVEAGATGGGLVGAASLELTQLLSQEGRALTHQSLSLRTNKTSSASASADEAPRIQFRHNRDIIFEY